MAIALTNVVQEVLVNLVFANICGACVVQWKTRVYITKYENNDFIDLFYLC